MEWFWQEDMKNKEKRYHPTQKPVYVMRWIIDNYTKENNLILDPFMGSGSTGIACAIGGRKFIGIEKEKQYFDIACKRIRWASKQQALF
jgi:DNA modification methylase